MSFRLTRSFLLACFLGAVRMEDLVVSSGEGKSVPSPSPFRFPAGSADLCPQKINRLEALPGYGWDNLRNVEMSDIIEPAYTRCQVTNDRKFLIPDGLQVHAQKRSDVKIYSELFENISDYRSSTSSSLSVDASLGFGSIGSISASFSREHETAKRNMVQNRAVTTRAQFRYIYYTIQDKPDAPLAHSLKKRLYDIASFIQSNHTDHVRYLAGLLVRDYGTHYVKKVDVGAALVKEDQIKSSYAKDQSMNKDSITVAASASLSFAVSFSISSKYTRNATEKQMNSYLHNVTNSEINSYGGPPIGGDPHFTLSTWLSDVENNLVTVDRSGDPLWFVVTPTALPELPVDTVRDLASVVRDAVERYYQHNVYRGCTNLDSPNFSYIANLNDGTCKGPTNNYTFGGVYQTCTGGLCKDSFRQKNPLSGDYRCAKNYDRQLIYDHTEHNCIRKCHHFFGIRYGCWDDCSFTYDSPNAAHYEAYWCADTRKVQANSGYMFGGVYTDHSVNPVTRGRSCPPHFIPLTIGKVIRMSVCVSDDYELAFRYSLPFAGFFTCKTGNPLSISTDPLHMMASNAAQPAEPRLNSYVYQAGPKEWPKRCPSGYSQHMVAITEDGCEINYCVMLGALVDSDLPNIKRPPFSPKPEVLTNSTRLLATASGFILSKSGDATDWTKIQTMSELKNMQQGSPLVLLQEATQPASGDDGLSRGATAAISVLGTALIGAFFILGVTGCQRYRKKKQNALLPWRERQRGYASVEEPNVPNTQV